ncbi:MAG: PKD domain-containing protein [Thermoanaerobaculia bacterium]|nr:PKD domain-containing protein [Thermoanaerobaculia bacterium]
MGTNTIFNDVFFVNADTGWVVGAGGTIRKTTNGGVTWTPQGAGTTSFNGVYFINADTGWVVGNSGTIRRTTNGGQNWTLHLVPGNPVNLNAIYFVDNHNGWVVGNNGKIFTSENGGAVWDEQSSGTSNHLYGVHFTDSQNGWAAGTVGTISRTTNGGAWNAQSFGVAQTLRAVHFPVDQIGWAVGDNGTIIKYNAAPTATFTWSAQGGNVDFKNTSTGAVSWHWDFGDGIFSNEEHPQHTYTTDGTYTVRLRVANACGTVLTTSQTVTIILPPSPPVAGFTATPTTGCTPLSVQFDANSSGATAWQWIFNGGTPATSTDQNPTVTYTAPGTYTVTLTVSNTAGTDSLTQTNYITVNTPPTADFTLNANGFNVTLNNQSVNAISYVWDAPGGTLSNSTAVNPTVTYTGPGTYKVTLTASNACGTGAAMQSVTILPPAPRRLYVDHEAGGTNDGSSWENAFRRLQDALNTAISGDTIWVAEGTYLPTETYGGAGDRYRAFNITGKGVAIFGGFNATETLLSQRDWKKYPTSLSGDIGVPGDAADNAYHVIYMRDLPPTARLDGFTVTGGRADSSGSEDSGGGVFNTGSSASNPTFANCIFTGNSAVQLGGAMLNSSKTGVVSLINCIFSRNSANYGGAMFNEGSGNLALINCVFWDNSAANWRGAMLNISLNSLIATNCTFSGNWAAIQGGSMANLFLNVTTTNCIFWGERAGTDPVFYNFSSSVTAGHCLTDASDCNALGAGVTCGPGMHFDTDPMFADTSNGDLRLQSCSPAIDAGLDSAVPAGMITDLAGKSRYFKSTTLLQATVDIGAYEYQGQKAPCSGLTLFVGSACGAPGDILVIPVTVQGFTNIAAIQGTVSLIPGPFSPIGVQSNTSAAMSANPSGNAMSWLWWNTPSGGMTLSPGDTLFFVLVQVDPAALPGSGPVVAQIDSTLLNLKAFQPPNNPVPVTAVGGDFCVLDEILVCGVVASENGQGVESVQVTITNISNSSVDTVLTGPDGIYQQGNLNAGKDYLVEPSKSGANPGCIDVLSVWLLNQILLGNMPYVSNYQKIAADVLTDKVINWSDLFALIDLIQNNTSLNWRFHAVHHPLPLLDQTAVVPHLNEYYELLNLSADTCGLDFIAIPLGALAGPANCYTGNTAVARADALDIQVETAWREKDGLFEVRLKGLSRSDIIALQAPLRFDETQLEFLRVEPGCFDGWTNGTIPHPWAERGLLPLVWFASGPAANGCTGADGDVLCSLVFRLRPGARPESLGLDMFEKGMPARAYTTDRTAMEIRLSESLIKSDAPRLLRNRPNPFAEETVIPVYLPANTVIAEVRITDLLGREIEHFWIEGRGELSVPFRYDGYRPGVLFYSLFVDGKLISTQRMVVQYADK